MNPGDNKIIRKSQDKKPKTRKEIKTQRDKWRIAKQIYRSKLSSYKLRWIREKDKINKRKKKADVKQPDSKLLVSPSIHGLKVSQKTIKNTACTVKKSLPSSPTRFAAVVLQVEKSSTPRKRKALEEARTGMKRKKLLLKGETSEVPNTKKGVGEGKRSQALITENGVGKDKTHSHVQFQTKINYITQKLRKRSMQILSKTRRKRIDATSARTKKIVTEYYYRAGRPLPHKRYASKYGPAYLMQLTLKSAYRQFQLEHPAVKIGFTKFSLLRPRNVRLLTRSHWEFCVCTVCQNIKYKVRALNMCASKARMHHLKIEKEHRGIIDLVLCPKADSSRFHASDCVYGTCGNCKNYGMVIKEHYKELLTINPVVVWHHWERKVEEDGIARKRLITKKRKVSDATEELISDTERPVLGTSFPKHIFEADWQQMQFCKLRSNLPDETVGWLFLA